MSFSFAKYLSTSGDSGGDPGAVTTAGGISLRVFQNVSALTFGQLFYRVVMLFVSFALARYLGVVEQGTYSLVMNFIAIFQAFSDLGIANLVIRDMNQKSAPPATLLGQYLAILLAVNLLLFVGAAGTALVIGYETRIVHAILLAGLGMIFSGVSSAFFAGLAGMERMKLIALLEMCQTVVLAAGMLIVMYTGGALVALTVVAAVGGAARLALFAWPVKRLIRGVQISRNFDRALAMLKRGLPFTLHAGLYIVFTKVDVIILAMLSDKVTLGLYTAATRLTFPLSLVSMMTATALFPQVSRYIKTDPPVAMSMVSTAMRWLLLLGLCIAIPVTLFASPIVGIIFGREFLPVAPILRVLIWYIPIFSFYQVVSDLLVAADRVWSVVIIGVVCLALNVTLNIVLIPMFGAFGAAWTSVGTELLRCALFIGFAVAALGFLRPSRAGGRAR